MPTPWRTSTIADDDPMPHAGCTQSCLGGGTARSLLMQAVGLHKPIGPRRSLLQSDESKRMCSLCRVQRGSNYNPENQRSHDLRLGAFPTTAEITL